MQFSKDDFKQRLDNATDNPFIFGFSILLFVILLAIALKSVASNIAPYIAFTNSQQITPSNIPIIGWGFDILTILYVATGAFILWFLIQICQITWILIAIDRKSHRAAIREAQKEIDSQSSDGEQDGQQSDRAVRKIRKRAVKIPFFFMAASGYIALGSFIAEFIINVRYFPVITNWNRFISGLTIGTITGIDTQQLLYLCSNLFATELLVIALVMVGQWIWSHQNG